MKCLGLLGLEREPGMLKAYVPPVEAFVKATDADPHARPMEEILSDPRPRFIHSHVHEGLIPPLTRDPNKVVYIIRDPRNVAVSYMRYHSDVDRCWPKASKEYLQKTITASFMNCNGVTKVYGFYDKWLIAPNTLVVRFEDLISDDGATARRIAEFLGIPYQANAYGSLLGNRGEYKIYHGARDRYTWTGRLSNWRDWWDRDIDRVWRNTEGPGLLLKLGYGDIEWR